MNRLKILPIAHQFIHAMLSGKFSDARCVADPLPDDAIIVAVNTDGRTLFLTYQSQAFEKVPQGNPLPLLTPMLEQIPPAARFATLGVKSTDDPPISHL